MDGGAYALMSAAALEHAIQTEDPQAGWRALREVIYLHAPSTGPARVKCLACPESTRNGEFQLWPCATIRAVIKGLAPNAE